MLKRIIIPIILTASVLLTSCSHLIHIEKMSKSDFINTNKTNSLKVDKNRLDDKINFSPYYNRIKLRAGYNTLESDTERRVYREISAHCADFTDEKESPDSSNYKIKSIVLYGCAITRRLLAKTVMAFFQDNPSVFWIDEPYSFSISGDTLTLSLYSVMTEAEYNKRVKQLNAVINSILKKMKKGMSEFERELYIHDYLVKNCKYLKNADDENKDPYTLYGALVNQSAVCMGYASAFQLLLSYVGIKSAAVYGSDTASGHIWNCVKIGGDWYYTDVTWDDTGDFFMYDNFNITTKQLKKTHTLVPKITAYNDKELFGKDGALKTVNLIIPECTATKYNYYKYKGSVMKDITENRIAEDLAKAAKNKEQYFYIYVHPRFLNYKTTYNQLFSDDLFGFSNYIRKANSIAGGDILKTAVSVTAKKNLNTISVELQYN